MYNLARHNLQIEYQPWLLGCLATELGMGWRAGSTDFFCSPYLMVRYDPTWRCHCGDLSAPGQFPMGCKWQRFLGKNFSVTWKCGPPISNKLILAVFGLCRMGSPPPMARVWWNTSWWAALKFVAIGWQLLPVCGLWFFQILKMLPYSPQYFFLGEWLDIAKFNRNLQGCFTDKRITQKC